MFRTGSTFHRIALVAIWVMLLSFVFLPVLAVFGSDPKPSPKFPRVLCFTAKWCRPCQKMKEDAFEWLEGRNWQIDETSQADLQVVDVDAHPDLMKRFKIESMPTLILIDEYGELSRSGYASHQTFKDLCKKAQK